MSLPPDSDEDVIFRDIRSVGSSSGIILANLVSSSRVCKLVLGRISIVIICSRNNSKCKACVL